MELLEGSRVALDAWDGGEVAIEEVRSEQRHSRALTPHRRPCTVGGNHPALRDKMTAPTRTVPTDIAHYLKAAPPFVQRVADAADRIDAERQMPADLAADMADAGFFRLLLPRALGGAELAHPDFLRILELFAGVDASVAWCLNQNNVFSTSASRMSVDTAHLIWDEPRAVVTNGPRRVRAWPRRWQVATA